MNRAVYKNFLWKDTDQAQQLLVENDIVVSRGENVSNVEADIVDRSGYRLYPNFVDNHTHVLPTGLDLAKLNLREANTKEEVLELVAQRHRDQPDGWLLAVHYDQNRWGGSHLTATELDAISVSRPILLRHVNGHAGIANSAAFHAARIPEDIEDGQGATYVRDATGRLNGVLLEHALERVSKSIPKPTQEEMVQAILAAVEAMAAQKISLTSDMQTGFFDLFQELQAYRIAAERGAKVAVRLYLQWGRVFGPKAPDLHELQEVIQSLDGDRCRVQGIKLFADGAIGLGTAAIYGGYADEQQDQETSGTLIYKPDVLKSRIKRAAEEGWQVSVHSIGDYSSDLVMEAFEETPDPTIHRLEHAMLLSPSQIERLGKVGCRVSVQPEFLHQFGKTYKAKLGTERAWNLIPLKSLLQAGLRVSLSSDRPITTGDPELAMEMATNRPDGFNPDENCSRSEGLEAYTSAGAEITGDEKVFTGLKTGAHALLNWIPV